MRLLSSLSAVVSFISLVLPTEAANATSINSQVRLAYAGTTGMVVSWNTFTKVANPTVIYGLTASAMTLSASSDVSVTYTTSLTYNNHVKITGLKPDTIYYYMPTTLIAGNYTVAPYTFRTARAAGDGTAFAVAVAIDLGTMGPQGLTTTAGKGVGVNNTLSVGDLNTIESMAKYANTFDVLLHPGDIAYADAWLKEEIQGFLPNTTIADGYKVYESILNDFYDEMTTVTTIKPYMVGPGNHEANCLNGAVTDSTKNISYNTSICMPGQTNFTGFINHFRMPSQESNGTGNFWYSYDHGMTHFISLDTETDLGHGFIGVDEVGGDGNEASGPFSQIMNAQTDWLAADLAKVNRTKTPWVIVTGHRPWYLSATNVSTTICTSCRTVFEPLFLQYGIDLYMNGHQHVYEREAPIANGIADKNELNNPSAPWYITNGAAGHYDGLDVIVKPIKNYSRFSIDSTAGNKAYGWSRLTFHNCTHLTHEFISSRDGAVLDRATLFKNRTCAFTSSAATNTSSGPTSTTTTGPATVTATGDANMEAVSFFGLAAVVGVGAIFL